jgi:hypothetical protein
LLSGWTKLMGNEIEVEIEVERGIQTRRREGEMKVYK